MRENIEKEIIKYTITERSDQNGNLNTFSYIAYNTFNHNKPHKFLFPQKYTSSKETQILQI